MSQEKNKKTQKNKNVGQEKSSQHKNLSKPRTREEPKGHDRIVISWKASEYIQHQKTVFWYFGALLVLIAWLLLAFWTGNWSMALALIVFAGVYQYLHTHHPPKQIDIEISELGIKVGQQFYPFSHIQAFWIFYEHGLRTLNIRAANHFFSDVIIQLGEQDPVEVRQYLVSQIPEWEGKTERMSDMILRLLKL